MFKETLTALITPMRNGAVDEARLRELVEFQIAEGINGLVPCGTTGETPTLSDEEQSLVIRTVVAQAKGRVPVLAGAGANDTKKALSQSLAAAKLGVDGLLHVTPYYNKPPQAGLAAHFRTVADASPIPLVLYNVPGRTGCDMLPETIAALADHPKIAAIKEATGSIARGQQVMAACGGKSIDVLSGDDGTCLALTLMGAQGVISVISNIAPKKTSEMIRFGLAGKVAEARQLHYELLPLMDLLFLEANPIPVKAAMAELGFCENEVRAPLTPLGGENLERLRAELSRMGLSR